MKKFLVMIFAVLAIFSGCSNPEEAPEHTKTPEASDAQIEQEYDFETLAKKMGYTEEQLSYNISVCLEEGLSEKAVLNPLEHAKEFGKTYTTSDGKYTLGTFFFDPERFADYGGPIGFAYVSTEDSLKILPENIYHLYSYGMVDDEYFAFENYDGINFYRFDDTSKPAYTWYPKGHNPEEEYDEWILEFSAVPERKAAAVFTIDMPEDFGNIYNHQSCDTSSTYLLYLIGSEGFEKTIDTGINFMFEYQGLPDVVRPQILFYDEEKIRFKIHTDYYEYYFETEEISVYNRYAYLEDVDPEVLKYAEYFNGGLEYLICDPYETEFSPKQMGAYTYHKSLDPATGKLSKELYSENSKKFFGIDLLEYDTGYIDDGTGNIIAKNGYSPSPSEFILKNLYSRFDGSKKAVFYHVGTDFYEPEYIDTRFGGTNPFELIYNGEFADAAWYVNLVEVVFFEYTDENGEFYIEPVSVYKTGSLPTEAKGYVYKSEKAENSFFDTEIPDISSAKNEKLDYLEDREENWCINGSNNMTIDRQFYNPYDDVLNYAADVYNVTDHKYGAVAAHSFMGLENADYLSLLYSAVYATPECYYYYEDDGNALSLISKALGFDFLEVVYGEDVEKTFRYLFGDEVEYVPANLEEYAYRYIPEADVYITYSEFTKGGAYYPIVVDYGPSTLGGSVYDVVFTHVLPDGSLSVDIGEESIVITKENAEELLPKLTVYSYFFNRGSENNSVLYGIKIKEP